ncbi:MAG: hypothetical protein H7317_18250 [Pseudorhodobacter sp.]|nr:hypothetical protein [Pseudorhodobacter sp.]
MKLPIIAVLVLALGVGSCGRIAQSRFNPLNWFGQARPTVVTTLYVPPEEKRPLVAQVMDLKVEAYPGGAIVRATGLPPTLGYWQAELVAQPVDAEGRLVFEFRIFAPLDPQAPGTPYARQINVAASVSAIRLAGVRSVVVQGASNALTVGR